ncbi:NADPH-dependent oxidoreductase [Flammeovirga pectinis]|uniref:NADPH-dependent oxidoreductase n=1 Tax=Flammeovirga pectinis TaxID=2494373 RepID=A0A3Q9FQ72_9BACT|nr:NAD(P)H-dependent oxidoreductase [Flammeovirga pectinis]AZQ63493.1 NADPH-dependent oxidoreductase [Flammeovirga pectinis]
MKIVILSGSVRDDRHTHGVALHLCKRLSEIANVEAEVIDLKEWALPPLTNTLHDNSPDNVKKLGAILDKADGIIFASPEYNGSYSSALKNAIDFYPKGTYQRKPIGVVSVSAGALGGIRAAQSLQLQILALMAYPIYRMLTVPTVQNKIDQDGLLIDPEFEKTMTAFVDEYLWFAEAIVAKKK